RAIGRAGALIGGPPAVPPSPCSALSLTQPALARSRCRRGTELPYAPIGSGLVAGIFLAAEIGVVDPAHGVVVGKALDRVPHLAVVRNFLVRPYAHTIFPRAQDLAIGLHAHVEGRAGGISDGADGAVIVLAVAIEIGAEHVAPGGAELCHA